jgi:hypothetical protein
MKNHKEYLDSLRYMPETAGYEVVAAAHTGSLSKESLFE